MSKVLILQHLACEPPGAIESVLRALGRETERVLVYEGQPVPRSLDDYAGLIVLGGSMSVYEQDRFPFLTDELRLIERTLADNKPLLGVCLGSQLLAAALGANVRKGAQKEIGWYPVTLTEAGVADPLFPNIETSFTAFHWHGDVFDLPSRAVHLAYSALTPCQAFRFGENAYGLLFHLEVTRSILRGMTESFPEELAEVGLSGEQVLDEIYAFIPPLERISANVFSRWVDLL